jgi:hypothetical protein
MLKVLKDMFKKTKRSVRDFCVSQALISSATETRESPSGRYTLKVEFFKTGENTWNYTKGTVYSSSGDKIVSVYRNYSQFWNCWVEGHADGHDYMLCGENYQGQTIIQLDTGKRIDYLPKSAKCGVGFCWAKVVASPDKTKLCVDGCYWGAPYEIRIKDFSYPMNMPYKDFEELDEAIYSAYRWLNDEEVLLKSGQEGRKSDGKLESELTKEEFEKIEMDYERLGFFEVLSVWNSNTGTIEEVGRKESNEDDWTWVEEAIKEKYKL